MGGKKLDHLGLDGKKSVDLHPNLHNNLGPLLCHLFVQILHLKNGVTF